VRSRHTTGILHARIPAVPRLIIRASPRETVSLPVAPWARAYGLDRDPARRNGTVPLLGPGLGFDRAYAMTTDLAQSVLIATVPPASGPPFPHLIDGYALPVTVRSEAAAVHWSVPKPRRSPPRSAASSGTRTSCSIRPSAASYASSRNNLQRS
jgi:hypothetical protein